MNYIKDYNDEEAKKLYDIKFVKFPGPAFKTQYDNKYDQKTVFAND